MVAGCYPVIIFIQNIKKYNSTFYADGAVYLTTQHSKCQEAARPFIGEITILVKDWPFFKKGPPLKSALT